MKINFAEVEGGFEAIPAGLYPAVCEKVEVRESKSSDNNYLNWEWTITEGEHEGRKMWQITSLSPKAFFRLKDQFEALGYDVEVEDFELDWDEDVQITPSAGPLLLEPDVSGMAATLVVTVEMYDNKERNRVDEVRGAGDDQAEPAKANARPGKSNSRQPAGRRALR